MVDARTGANPHPAGVVDQQQSEASARACRMAEAQRVERSKSTFPRVSGRKTFPRHGTEVRMRRCQRTSAETPLTASRYSRRLSACSFLLTVALTLAQGQAPSGAAKDSNIKIAGPGLTYLRYPLQVKADGGYVHYHQFGKP